jgi:hypothetical protein
MTSWVAWRSRFRWIEADGVRKTGPSRQTERTPPLLVGVQIVGAAVGNQRDGVTSGADGESWILGGQRHCLPSLGGEFPDIARQLGGFLTE